MTCPISWHLKQRSRFCSFSASCVERSARFAFFAQRRWSFEPHTAQTTRFAGMVSWSFSFLRGNVVAGGAPVRRKARKPSSGTADDCTTIISFGHISDPFTMPTNGQKSSEWSHPVPQFPQVPALNRHSPSCCCVPHVLHHSASHIASNAGCTQPHNAHSMISILLCCAVCVAAHCAHCVVSQSMHSTKVCALGFTASGRSISEQTPYVLHLIGLRPCKGFVMTFTGTG